MPTVATGEGLTYASAARNPGVLEISAGAPLSREDIDGVLVFALRFEGLIVVSSERWRAFFWSTKEADDALPGEFGGRADIGSIWSS